MEKKLGLSALTALVLSSMLGAGVFSLPQNMAAVASPSALIIGWGITVSEYCCWPSPCCC
jgi:arginine:ornithine antiporter/lysine permease